jgi:hypothetical protein
MACTHDITERDVAVSADGMCPICQMETIGRLRNALRDIAEGADAKAFVKATALKALSE